MDKEIIKRIILEKQKEIVSIELFKRDIVLEPSANYVFVGLRRAGKSYLMYQHIQHLLQTKQAHLEDILYINFEDERISSVKAENLGVFLDAYNEMFDRKPILFLDEIQNIVGWEKFARRLADSKYRIFITGSNAKMLSREIYTTLGGRFIAKEIYPFTFLEYLNYHSIELVKNWEYSDLSNKVFKLFSNYFYYGGFAESFTMNDKRSWLNALYQKILLGDIVLRNDIRNENAIRVLVKKLAESVMQPSSLSRINNVVNSSGATIARNTMVDYLRFLSDSYLTFSISNYSDKLSEKETFKKRYFFDNGLLNNFLIDPETKLLENLAAITLKKQYDEELFYYNKNVEVDFYIPKEKLALQVSYSIKDDFTREREVSALLKLAHSADLNNLIIITFNEESTIIEKDKTINVTPIWKWLLSEKRENNE
ncbi:MAG: ATP-binding protein [Dysgonamonadaceae bacterium]|jgi:predicted AAA+ superfamily ATPase|nr:ATP-binding protein [Dysgonamonadaceae bacterium]